MKTMTVKVECDFYSKIIVQETNVNADGFATKDIVRSVEHKFIINAGGERVEYDLCNDCMSRIVCFLKNKEKLVEFTRD